MGKTAKKLINIVIAIIVIFLCVLAIQGIIQRKNPKKVSPVLGIRFLTVLSGSMRPKIAPGDVVVIRNVNNEKLKKGDIITFNREGLLITHRIKNVKNDGFITKGDANNTTDSIIKKSQILGKYVFKIPYMGFIALYLRKPYVVIPLIMVIGFYACYSILIYYEKKNKQN